MYSKWVHPQEMYVIFTSAEGRRRGGKTILKGGQKWTLSAQPGQLKTGQSRKGLL